MNNSSRRKKDAPLPQADGREKKTKQKSERNRGGEKSRNLRKESPLRLLPLGGLREIGCNMTVYEYGNDAIVVDCGTSFPDADTPGVDLIIPDFTYIRSIQGKLRGVFLTHGHEDHIGAIAWFMREFDCPVYGAPLTIKLAANKLSDTQHGGSSDRSARDVDPRLKIIREGERIQAGVFNVEFIHVNHSIADACALAIRTPVGLVVHTGDFKVDFTPVHGDPINLTRFAELGREGVLALFMESTNIEIPGNSPSERMVGRSFSEIFDDAPGRIFVATFSSNVFRIQQAISAAEANNRKVVLLGYSMLKVFEAADSLGYIHYAPDTIVEPWDAERYPDNRLVYLTTGSQGEPMSALSRMAFSAHRQVNIKEGDTVLLSSSMIPGNEKSIYRVINELFKAGANVIYEKLADLHVSGHAYRGELQLIFNLCHPKFFIPAHGEYRHIYKNAEMAHEQGLAKDHIFLLNNGDVLEFTEDSAEISDYIEESGGVLVDGALVGGIDELVLRERRLLADDGVIVCSIVVDRRKNKLATDPNLQALGFGYAGDVDTLIEGLKQEILNYVEHMDQKRPLGQALKQNALRELIRKMIYSETKRRPMVLISVSEI